MSDERGLAAAVAPVSEPGDDAVTGAFPARPVVPTPGPWEFPHERESRLDSGLRVLTHELRGQHVASVRLAVPLPIDAEPRDREGVGTMMARTLDEGTARRSADAMAELLERRGVSLGAGVGERGLVVDLEVPAHRLSSALELLAEVLAEPAFPASEVERQVRVRLADIDQESANPSARAAREFAATYYAPTSRISRPTAGSPDSIRALVRDDVAAHHAAWVRPDAATLVVAADLPPSHVEEVVGSALGRWVGATSGRPDTAGAVVPVAGVRADDAARIVLVDRPGSVQSELYVGCAGPGRDVDGGWAPFPVLAYVVGGSPQARLDAVLREERGYTYGVRSTFRARVGGGLFLTSGSVRAEASAPALDLTLSILDSLADGVTAAETRDGIDYLGRTAPGRYATADAVADEAVARALDGLSTRHTREVLAALPTLTPEDLDRAYAAHVDRRWTVVVVGDAAAIGDSLSALGRGEVTVVGG